MRGRTFIMEFVSGWKGLIIFLLIVILFVGAMPLIFPTFAETAKGLEGSENVEITVPEEIGGTITLSWDSMEGATQYVVMESGSVSMIAGKVIHTGIERETSFPKEFEGNRYYAVLGVTDDITEPTLIGMISTEKKTNPFDELLENPIYKGMTHGRTISVYKIEGYISLEIFSWWVLLVGLFLGYIAVNTVARDFEGKRMDLIFSTPLSREEYLIEKFLALTAYTVVLLLLAAGAVIGSVGSLELSDGLAGSSTVLAFIGSLPLLMVIISVGMLTAVYFRNARTAMGITFSFVFVEYILSVIGNLSEKFSILADLSIVEYWDYNAALYDNVLKIGEFAALIVLAAVVLVSAVLVFKRKDIPT
ncbi:MAG: ABC transporter permease subunit [Euryarchaeota archaeon]|nr:ABC transporter permease subunit [Euryarchaeota archaeon]